ncbi:MAG: MFS transporter [Chloroflexi bacterium]|nr:MFS transporter [Chloroflexota bacterium]
MPKKRKIFYGWWIVLASATINLFVGGTFFYGFSVFFNPIRATFHWTATVTSVAFVLQRLEGGISGPLVGFLVDRVGQRKLMLSGWSVVGLGFLWMSRVDSLWAFYGSFLIIAIGISFGSFVAMNVAVANWFIKKRSRAMTFMYVGFGASGTLVPLVALSISQFGWRTSLIIMGIAAWVIGLPLSSLMRHKPGHYGYLPDGETRSAINEAVNVPNSRSSSEIVGQAPDSLATDFTVKAALRTRAFWLLALVFFFQNIGTSAVMVHIVPYLENAGVPTTIAASAVAGMTLSSLIGRLGFGFLGDFTNKRYLIAISLLLQTGGLFIFSFIGVARVWLIVPFLLIYSPGYGGPIPLRPALQGDYFGTSNFGSIMGLMMAISMLGGLASPVIAGWIFDITGSYRLAWQIFALATLPAIPLVLLAKPPKAKPEP